MTLHQPELPRTFISSTLITVLQNCHQVVHHQTLKDPAVSKSISKIQTEMQNVFEI